MAYAIRLRAAAAAPSPEEREAAPGLTRTDEYEARPASAVRDRCDVFAHARRAWVAPAASARIVEREAAGQRPHRRVDIELVLPGGNSNTAGIDLGPRAEPGRRRNGRVVDHGINDLLHAVHNPPPKDQCVHALTAATASPEPRGRVLDTELDVHPELVAGRAGGQRNERRKHQDQQEYTTD